MAVIEAHVDVACAHCGLPVPAGLLDPCAEEQFCCHGCRGARALIRSLGLDGYYRVRGVEGGEGVAAEVTGRGFEEFDHEAFAARYVKEGADGTRSASLLACSIHCAACVWLIERLPRIEPGVVGARVDLRRRTVEVRWDPSRTGLGAIARRLDSLGYAPAASRGEGRREAERKHERKMLARLGVAGALAGNVMLISFALYGGVFHGIADVFEDMFRWAALGLAAVSLAWPGAVFFRGAIAGVRTRTLHMDMPIALGLLAGGVSGAVNTVRGAGEVYFDSVTALVFLLLLGRYLQHRGQRGAADSLEVLGSVTPGAAWLVAGDAVRSVPVEALQVGDVVEVRAGEVVPADGVVVRGSSDLDMSVLTGESAPVGVRWGDAAPAGAVNMSSVVRVRVGATGEETRIGRLMALVREGAARRALIARLADRVAGRFIAAVLTVAAITLGVWLWIDPSVAVDHTAALLIVTCPCALALATPLTISAAIGRGARRGILIKSGAALESLAGAGTLVLDKTGTVTRGAVALVEWIGDERAKEQVAAAERGCAHPIARALVDGLGASAAAVTRSAYTHGGGLEAEVDGFEVVVGSPAFVWARTGGPAGWMEARIAEATGRALTPVAVGVDGRAVALALLGDPTRDDAAAVIEGVRARGWRVVLLSGDHPDVARAVGRTLGIAEEDAIGGATPEMKERFVRGAAGRPVVMVGDGVNDAAALMSADVGVAVHGGAEASMQAADVYLSREGLSALGELMTGAARTIRTVKVCMGVSAGYNLVCAGLAVAGLITPLLAAVLMPLSSLTVVTIAYRARTFAGPKGERWN